MDQPRARLISERGRQHFNEGMESFGAQLSAKEGELLNLLDSLAGGAVGGSDSGAVGDLRV